MTPLLRYPYNPAGWLILFSGGIGAVVLGHSRLRGGSWVEWTIGSCLCLLCLALAFRRVFLPRFIELGPDALSLPVGFLRARVARIPYADIEWSRDSFLPATQIVQFRAESGTYEVVSGLFPDYGAFATFVEHLHLRVGEERQARPRPHPPIEGSGYVLRCSYHGNGTVCPVEGERRWRFETAGPDGPNRKVPYGLFRLPDFIVHDESGRPWLHIRRVGRFPLARFVVLESGVPVGTIRQRSPLLNRYCLEFPGGPSWRFHMPLFTVNFAGVSDAGGRIRVRLWSHNEWHVLVDTGADSPYLIAAMALIHRERLRCT